MILFINYAHMKHYTPSKKLIAALVVALGLAAGAVGANAAMNVNPANPMADIVSAIASKFNLKTEDVQKVFDEHHATMQSEHAARATDRLKQAVTDGKLTQAQADAIAAKHAEMKAMRDSLKDKTETERHEAMKAQMESLKQWAADNDIPKNFMMPFGPGKGRGERGFGHGPMGDDKAGDVSSN